MTFTALTRYGAMKSYSDESKIPSVVESLIQELETEQFDEPDDEHYQVAIGHGDWAVTVTVFGLMILDDMRTLKNGEASEESFIRAKSRQEAVAMLTLMAKGKIEEVRAASWVSHDRLPPYNQPLFRKQ